VIDLGLDVTAVLAGLGQVLEPFHLFIITCGVSKG
jgi:hypothetical protein